MSILNSDEFEQKFDEWMKGKHWPVKNTSEYKLIRSYCYNWYLQGHMERESGVLESLPEWKPELVKLGE